MKILMVLTSHDVLGSTVVLAGRIPCFRCARYKWRD
jgi:hypothetical protein